MAAKQYKVDIVKNISVGDIDATAPGGQVLEDLQGLELRFTTTSGEISLDISLCPAPPRAMYHSVDITLSWYICSCDGIFQLKPRKIPKVGSLMIPLVSNDL